jgi:hypothetical protein
MGSELESKCLSDNYEMGKRHDVLPRKENIQVRLWPSSIEKL